MEIFLGKTSERNFEVRGNLRPLCATDGPNAHDSGRLRQARSGIHAVRAKQSLRLFHLTPFKTSNAGATQSDRDKQQFQA